MEGDASVRLAIDAALEDTDLGGLLTGLIRVALGRRVVLEAALAQCRRHAQAGSDDHARAADRLEKALTFRSLWGG